MRAGIPALFILHRRSWSAEIAFWNQVAAELPFGSGFQLVGFCGASGCGPLPARLRFPILAYGEDWTMRLLLRADRDRHWIVADGRSVIIATPVLRDGAAPATIARELMDGGQ